MTRRSLAFLTLVAWLGMIPAAHARIPSLDVLTQPNAAKHLSFDSGLADIPACDGASARLGPIWLKAARTFHLKWQILAAITKVESGFGCNMGPSSAGAEGWTQFIPSTWRRWGTDADGDGRADPRNAVDAVFSTARYLRVTGAPADYRKAIFAYNHADWYVRMVLDAAATFGRFSLDEFADITELAQRGARLRDKLSRLEDQVDDAHIRLMQARRARSRARQQHDDTRQQFEDEQVRYDQLMMDLNFITVQYIQLTSGLAATTGTQMASDQVLSYVADADMQDAVLVYASARGLMDRQTRMMDELRDAGQQADLARQQLQRTVSVRQAALDSQRAAVRAAVTVSRQRVQALQRTERALRDLREAREAFGDLGADGFDTGSWTGETVVDPDWEGRYRWPVKGPVTGIFGEQRPGHRHAGIDIAAPEGRPVRAVAEGRVTLKQTSGQSGGYGNFVCVTHPDGLESCYAHLSAFAVRLGQRVEQSDKIGEVGNTGHSFGPHLHFEIRRNGRAEDPADHLPTIRRLFVQG